MKTKLSYVFYIATVLLAGSLLPMAFAPFEIYPLAIICPALLLFSCLNCNPKQAFWFGYLFGVGFFAIGASWIFVSVYQFSNVGVVISVLFTGVFILILAGFLGVQIYLLVKTFRGNTTKLCLAFPSLWVLFEWLRSWLFTGFPWLFLGTSQTTSWLRGFAPIFGEYGVSFLVALSSALLVLAIYNIYFRKFIKSFIAAFILISIWILGFALTQIHWTQPQGSLYKVALLQGDIPIPEKWNKAFIDSTLQRYHQFTEQHWNASLIVWPETAIPIWQIEARNYLDLLNAEAQKHNSALIVGIPVADGFNDYNAMMILGKGNGVYYKRHLVPFGEYTPLIHWLGNFFGFLNIPLSDFSSGPLKHPELHANGFIIAPFICYEIAYEQLVLYEMPKANLLVTISNDTWFGHSFAAAQHLQIGQFRALETGRYYLFATNSGITAIVNAQGEIQASAPSFKPTVLTGTVQAMQGTTPIARMGIMPIIIFIAALFMLVFWL